MKKLTRKHWIIISVTLLAISGVTIGTGFKAKGKDKEETILREYPVTRGDITAGIDSNGVLKLDGVDHRFDTEVLIEEVFVKQGQEVKKGDPLVKLSISDMNERIGELQEQLDKAKMNLDQARNNKKINELNQDKGWKDSTSITKEQYEQQRDEVKSNISWLENKEKELKQKISDLDQKINELKAQMDSLPPVDEGIQPPKSDEIETLPQLPETNDEQKNEEAGVENQVIEQKGITPRITLDELSQQLQLAIAERDALQQQLNTTIEELNAARKNLDQVESNRKKQVEKENQQKKETDEINNLSNQNQDDTISLAQMEVDKIKEEMSKLNEFITEPTIVSEVDGIVVEMNYSKNNKTIPESPGVKVGTTDKMNIVLNVAQNEIHQIKMDQKVKVKFTAYDDEEFMGYVKFRDLTSKVEGGSVVFKVTVELDETDYELLDGMTCDAQFLIKEVKDVIKLSNKAIQIENGKQFVTVQLEDGTLEQKSIKTGFSDGRYSEIIEGLNEGDVVVIGG